MVRYGRAKGLFLSNCVNSSSLGVSSFQESQQGSERLILTVQSISRVPHHQEWSGSQCLGESHDEDAFELASVPICVEYDCGSEMTVTVTFYRMEVKSLSRLVLVNHEMPHNYPVLAGRDNQGYVCCGPH